MYFVLCKQIGYTDVQPVTQLYWIIMCLFIEGVKYDIGN